MVSDLLSGCDLYIEIAKGIKKSVKNIGAVMVLILCTLSDNALYLY